MGGREMQRYFFFFEKFKWLFKNINSETQLTKRSFMDNVGHIEKIFLLIININH